MPLPEFHARNLRVLPIVCWAMLALLVAQPGVEAGVSRFRITHRWALGEGLPDAFVTALEVGPDGALWIGTRSGVARFNGRSMERVELGDGAPFRCTGMAFDDDGTGWFSSPTGLRVLSTASAPPAHRFARDARGWVTADGEGTLWLLDPASGLRALKGESVVHLPLPDEAHGQPHYRLIGRPRAGIWLLTSSGLLWSATLQGWSPLLRLPSTPEVSWVQAAVHPGGDLWVSWLAGETPHLAVWDGQAWTEAGRDFLARHGKILVFGSGPGGAFCGGTDRGHVVDLAHGLDRAESHPVAPGEEITAAAVDRAGNWWVGTSRIGLLRVVRTCASLISSTPPVRCRTLAVDATGGLLVGTLGQGIARAIGERLEPPASLSLSHPVVEYANSLLATPDGLWLGSELGVNFQPSAAGSPEPARFFPTTTSVLALCEDPGGTIWAGDMAGNLLRCAEGTRLDPVAALGPGAIVGLTHDGQRLWIASEAGLRCWSSNQVHTPALPGGTPGGVRCVAVSAAPEQRVVAALAGGGLLILSSNRVLRAGPPQGLNLPPINQLLFVDDHLWLGTVQGIGRIHRDDLSDFVAGRNSELIPAMFTETTGLPASSCTWGGSPTATQLPSGQLAFPTAEGVVLLDPHTLPRPLPPPRARIRTLEVDGIRTAPGEHPRLAARPRLVRIGFESVGIEHPGPPEVRYRLLPRTREWTRVDQEESVSLLGVPAGRHRFELEARGADGQWHGAPPFDFEVLPAWWEDSFVQALLALTAIGLPVGIVTRFFTARERRRAEAQSGQQRLVAERARIARDLHDDLGNRLTEIQMLAERVSASEGDGPGGTPETGRRVRQVCTDAIEALDHLVWLLNPRHDTWPSLLRMLEREASAFLEAAGVELDLRHADPLPGTAVEPALRQAILCSQRELLRNAVRHGHATRVAIEWAHRRDGFHLVVDDNGRGMTLPSEAATTLGRGLSGLQERAREFGGDLRARSSPSGTRVELTFSLRPTRPSPPA